MSRSAIRDFLRAVWSSLRVQGRILTVRPLAPLSLQLRVPRWYVRLFLRESAAHVAIAALVVCGLLWLLGVATSTLGIVAFALIAVVVVWEVRNLWLAHRSTEEIARALDDLEAAPAPKTPVSHLIFPPLMFATRGVRRERGVPFAEVDGARIRLDVYRPGESSPGPRPAVIQVHGGGWIAGSRFEQGIPLLNHLAKLGWVGFNIDYRLAPRHPWPAMIVDVKRAIAWIRENHERLGIDPDRIAITGGSAGGHLTALAGLTENDPAFQPGFEHADTSLAAAVPFYGIYDIVDEPRSLYPELKNWLWEIVVMQRPLEDAPEAYRDASPTLRVHPDAPPFLVIHGEADTLAPVQGARLFADALREVSKNDVRYIELPKTEHAFDLWPSERTVRTADAIGRFLDATVGERRAERPAPERVAA